MDSSTLGPSSMWLVGLVSRPARRPQPRLEVGSQGKAGSCGAVACGYGERQVMQLSRVVMGSQTRWGAFRSTEYLVFSWFSVGNSWELTRHVPDIKPIPALRQIRDPILVPTVDMQTVQSLLAVAAGEAETGIEAYWLASYGI